VAIELGYLTLSVKELERARKFYSALFGWEFEPGLPGEGYAHVKNTALPLGFTSDGARSFANLYFRVPDIAAAMARVRELGGDVVSEFSSPTGNGARCRDDQETEFSLWQAAPGF
jgi:predicted enzyme related to lactoylglutathione lyase